MSNNFDMERHWMKERQKRYLAMYKHPNYSSNGGIFTGKIRKRLLGIFGKTGRGRTKANFWYKVRENVKAGLIDLALFAETAEDKDVNKVLSRENLSPVVEALFPRPNKDTPKLIIGQKAMVAQLFIRSGFMYLLENSKYLTQKQDQEINDAIEFSKQLTILLLPDSERVNFL